MLSSVVELPHSEARLLNPAYKRLCEELSPSYLQTLHAVAGIQYAPLPSWEMKDYRSTAEIAKALGPAHRQNQASANLHRLQKKGLIRTIRNRSGRGHRWGIVDPFGYAENLTSKPLLQIYLQNEGEPWAPFVWDSNDYHSAFVVSRLVWREEVRPQLLLRGGKSKEFILLSRTASFTVGKEPDRGAPLFSPRILYTEGNTSLGDWIHQEKMQLW